MVKLARIEPDTVSLTAFNHLTLRTFLQGDSLTRIDWVKSAEISHFEAGSDYSFYPTE